MLGRIILGFSKNETAVKIGRMLESGGYDVFAACRSKDEIVRIMSEIDDAFVIMGFKLADATVNDVVEDLPPDSKVIALLKPEQRDYIKSFDIYVVGLPVNAAGLVAAIERLEGFVKKSKRAHRVRSDAEKEIIERAKRLLMESHFMTEEQAHRFIQKKSMDTGARFVDTARFILG